MALTGGGHDLIELIVSFSLLIICVSYMILGCAGHRRRTSQMNSQAGSSMAEPQAEGESVAPSGTESQATGVTGQGEQQPPLGSEAPTETATAVTDTKSQPGASNIGSKASPSGLGGYQSQTSEILAGPGEEPLKSSVSTLKEIRPSGISRIGGSNIGSVLSSATSRANSSSFGSTLDSSTASGHSRAAGASSVLSMLSRSGHSNIQSTLSSTAPSSAAGGSVIGSRVAGSSVGASSIGSQAARSRAASRMGSTLESTALSHRSVRPSTMGQASVLSAADRPAARGHRSRANSRSHHASNIASTLSTQAPSSMASGMGRRSSAVGSSVSRQTASSVAASSTSPASAASDVPSVHTPGSVVSSAPSQASSMASKHSAAAHSTGGQSTTSTSKSAGHK